MIGLDAIVRAAAVAGGVTVDQIRHSGHANEPELSPIRKAIVAAIVTQSPYRWTLQEISDAIGREKATFAQRNRQAFLDGTLEYNETVYRHLLDIVPAMPSDPDLLAEMLAGKLRMTRGQLLARGQIAADSHACLSGIIVELREMSAAQWTSGWFRDHWGIDPKLMFVRIKFAKENAYDPRVIAGRVATYDYLREYAGSKRGDGLRMQANDNEAEEQPAQEEEEREPVIHRIGSGFVRKPFGWRPAI